jgi:hypothetical protein
LFEYYISIFNNISVLSWWSALSVEETRVPRENHSTSTLRFVRIGSTGDQQKHNFFVRTIKDWNDLPPDILGIDDYEAFKTSLIVCRSQ